MSGRCPTHDLALSPEGDCVVCRRESSRSVAVAVEAGGTGVWTRALGGLAIVAVAGVIALSGLIEAMRAGREDASGPEPSVWQVGAPADPALAQARGQVAITMYSTSWCGACRVARRYFDERGIAYRELDVERDRSAALRMRELNPRGSVPTIDIEGQVLVGFSSRAIEAAIDSAARRRL